MMVGSPIITVQIVDISTLIRENHFQGSVLSARSHVNLAEPPKNKSFQ